MDHFYINWPTPINGYRPKEMLCEFLDFNNLKYSQMEDHQHFLRLVETESKNFILDRETFFVMIDDICNDTRRINSYKKHRYIFYQYLDGCPFYWLKNYKQKLHDYKKNQTLINSLSVSVLSDGYHGKILQDFFYGFNFHQIHFNWFHLYPYYHLGTVKQNRKDAEFKKDFLLLAVNKHDRDSRNIIFTKLKGENLLDNNFIYKNETENALFGKPEDNKPEDGHYFEQYRLPDLMHLPFFDKWLDNSVVDQIGYPLPDYYNSTNCEIICESYRGDTAVLTNDDSYHLTEKTIRPIIMGHPFIMLGAPGNLKTLKKLGFQTFSKYIDESYDEELDLEKRCDKIIETVQSIIEMGSKNFYESCYEERKHNFNHIYTLIGNFKKEYWNNLKKFFIKTAKNA